MFDPRDDARDRDGREDGRPRLDDERDVTTTRTRG